MGREPLVSIMIPAHKPARFGATLASALAQEWPNLEIVISDDSAGDSIARLVEPHRADPRVAYSRHPRPAGIVSNYRRLLGLARGDWGLFLDDDDLLYPGAVATLVSVANRHPGVVLVYAGYDLVDLLNDRKRCLRPGRDTVVRAGAEFFRNFQRWPPATISVLFDVAAARAARIFTDLPNIKSGDWEAWLKIALAGKVISHPVVTGCHFRHEASYSSIPSLPMDLRNALFIHRAAAYAAAHGALSARESARWRRRTLAWYLTWIVAEHVAAGRVAELGRGLLGLLWTEPGTALRLLANPALCGAVALRPFPALYGPARQLYRRLRFGAERAPHF